MYIQTKDFEQALKDSALDIKQLTAIAELANKIYISYCVVFEIIDAFELSDAVLKHNITLKILSDVHFNQGEDYIAKDITSHMSFLKIPFTAEHKQQIIANMNSQALQNHQERPKQKQNLLQDCINSISFINGELTHLSLEFVNRYTFSEFKTILQIPQPPISGCRSDKVLF